MKTVLVETAVPTDDDLVLEVATDRANFNLVVPRALILKAFQEPDLEKRADMILDLLPGAKTTTHGDYDLVLDGEEDANSWEDLREYLADDGITV